MIKKLIFSLILLFHAATVNAAEMVNVEYIHKLIEREWDIDLPYNPQLENPKVAANMKYLLTAIDRANERVNGVPLTNYGNDEKYATLAAADTIATNEAVARLIEDLRPKFWVTTTPNPESFTFYMGSIGKFLINWGDGTIDIVERKRYDADPYSHEYADGACKKSDTDDGSCTISIGGRSKEYQMYRNSISFDASCPIIASIGGSLGAIFGDPLSGVDWPMFTGTFQGCSNLTEVPDDLFAGITKVQNFYYLFKNCSNLETIPDTLFKDLDCEPQSGMFLEAFAGTKIKSVPYGLFAGVKGAPAVNVYANTFQNCTELEEIPDDLFAGLEGPPARNMFHRTFQNCSNLKSIPKNLFGTKLSGPMAASMFFYTFSGCTSLTGPSARIDGKYLYEIWPDGTGGNVCYYRDTGLDDYDQIPSNWIGWGS